MKHFRLFICLTILIITFNINLASAAINSDTSNYPTTNSKAAILIDASSGRVLYEHNSHEHLPPASLTKIMTALLVVENGNLEKKVLISKHAADTPECTVYLEEGETLTRMELLYAALLPSANDASVALAESISGSESNFIDLMNNRVNSLGLTDTHFLNPHGLEARGHYSSAYDLAVITREALTYDTFVQISSSKRGVIPWESRPDEDRILLNQNRLLSRYEGAIGVKTGYTKQAGNCVVGAAQKGDMTLIAVSLNSPTVYDDLIKMLDYGFDNYKLVTLGIREDISTEVKVLKGEINKVNVKPIDDIAVAVTEEEELYLTYTVNLEPNVTAPVEKDYVLGECKIFLQEEEIGIINMVTTQTVSAQEPINSFTDTITSKWGIILIVSIICFITYLRRRKLEETLKQVLLYLLRNKISKQTNNHRL